MLFTRSLSIEPSLLVLDSAGSTNSELSALVDQPDCPQAIVTLDQTAGRGRMGRTWSAVPGTSLAVSVLLDPGLDRMQLAPLVAGLAMTRAVRSLVPRPDDVWLKWPNDVLTAEKKVSGILGEVVGARVVMGAGLNLTMTEAQLPVPSATSLVLEGADPRELADRALAAYLEQLRYADAEHDLIAAVSAVCSTLGRIVTVDLPDGSVVRGRADRLDADGRLVIDGVPGSLSAGDVTHVR